LAQALKGVKAQAATTPKWKLLLKTCLADPSPESARPYLERMNLTYPQKLRDKVVRMLLVEQLKRLKALG